MGCKPLHSEGRSIPNLLALGDEGIDPGCPKSCRDSRGNPPHSRSSTSVVLRSLGTPVTTNLIIKAVRGPPPG